MNRKLYPDFKNASPTDISEYASQVSQIIGVLNVHDINGVMVDKIVENWVSIWNKNYPNLPVILK